MRRPRVGSTFVSESGTTAGVATLSLMLVMGMLLGAELRAADRGTADQAKALLQKAVEHYKQVGRKQALEDFTGKRSPWVNGDLYVACSDSNHVLVANGAFPSYVGTSLDTVKDAQGKPLGQSLKDAAAKGGIQSVEWKWYNPVSGKLERKISLVEKVDDLTCSVGYYP